MKTILNKLTDYFSYKEPIDSPETIRMNDLTIIVGINVSLFGFLMFLTRIALEGSSASKTIWVLPIATGIITISLFAIKFFNKAKIPIYTMLIAGTFTILLRSAFTGGILSPVAIWLTLMPTLAIILLPLKHSLVCIGISFMSLIPLSFPHRFGLPITQHTSSVTIQFIVVGIFILIFSFVIFFYERERLRNEKKILESEKKLAVNNRLIALGNISGGLSHEINNPLAIVKGNVDLIKLRLKLQASLTSHDLDIPLSEMKQNIQRIQGIIDSMRTFTNDDFFIATDVIHLRPVIEAAFENRSGRLKNSKIDFKIEVGSELRVKGNRESILRIFLNLLDNSIDEIKDTPSSWIHVKTNEEKEFVTITFTDSGNKIKKEIEERIMEPFFSTKQIGSGIGLGLTICYNLMKIQGGSIHYNPAAENTSFILKFPK